MIHFNGRLAPIPRCLPWIQTPAWETPSLHHSGPLWCKEGVSQAPSLHQWLSWMHLDWFVNLCVFTIFAYISQLPLSKVFPPNSSSYCITYRAQEQGNHNLFKSLDRIRIIDWSLHVAVSMVFHCFSILREKCTGILFMTGCRAPGFDHQLWISPTPAPHPA